MLCCLVDIYKYFKIKCTSNFRVNASLLPSRCRSWCKIWIDNLIYCTFIIYNYKEVQTFHSFTHSIHHYYYRAQEVFFLHVLTSHCSAATSNSATQSLNKAWLRSLMDSLQVQFIPWPTSSWSFGWTGLVSSPIWGPRPESCGFISVGSALTRGWMSNSLQSKWEV